MGTLYNMLKLLQLFSFRSVFQRATAKIWLIFYNITDFGHAQIMPSPLFSRGAPDF